MISASAWMMLCLGWHGHERADLPASALPDTWHGVWTGKLTIRPLSGKAQELQMEMHVAPIKGRNALTWRIIYGTGDKKQVRDYELLPEKDKPGQFKIDEKNGIVIDARLAGNALHSHFKVNDNLITAKYERRGETLWVEITSVSLKEPRMTGIKERKIEVQSYQLQTVQIAELRKK